MKRHATKTPKNMEALSQVLWRRSINHDPRWIPARLRSHKGKKGFTRRDVEQIVESLREQGMGRVESVRYIESAAWSPA